MEENPDPYNDKKNLYNDNKTQDSQSVQRTIEIEDDFEMNSEVLDQIEKQIQQQNCIVNTDSSASASGKRGEHKITAALSNNINNFQGQAAISTSKSRNFTNTISERQQYNCETNLNVGHNKIQTGKFNIQNKVMSEEDDNSLLEIVDDQIFQNIPTPSYISTSSISTAKKQSSSIQLYQNQNEDDFPLDDEIYDINEQSCSFFKTSKTKNESLNVKESLLRKNSIHQSIGSNKNTNCKSNNSEQKDISIKSTLNKNPSDVSSTNLSRKLRSSLQSVNIVKPSVSSVSHFQSDDFEMEDFDEETDKNRHYLNKNKTSQKHSNKSSQASTSSLSKLNTKSSMENNHSLFNNKEDSNDLSYERQFQEYDSQYLENEFANDFDNEFANDFDNKSDNKMDIDNKLSTNDRKVNKVDRPKIENKRTLIITPQTETTSNSTLESTRFKRLAVSLCILKKNFMNCFIISCI
jgi:hypothetical protein